MGAPALEDEAARRKAAVLNRQSAGILLCDVSSPNV